MNKVLTYIVIIASLLFLSGCDGLDLASVDLSNVSEDDINKVIVCNEPYIRFGTGCCLDQNSNNICDDDESNNDDMKVSESSLNDDNDNDNDYIKEKETKKVDTEKEKNQMHEYEGHDFDLDLEVYEEVGYFKLEWNNYNKEDFKYYKIMHSINDGDNLVYPSDYVVGVIDNNDEHYFKYESLEKGKHYFRVGVVLDSDDIIYSDVEDAELFEEKSDIEVKVEIYGNYSDVKVDIGDDKHEFETNKTDIVEIKKLVSEEFDIDYNLVVDIIEVKYKDSEDDNDDDDSSEMEDESDEEDLTEDETEELESEDENDESEDDNI